MRIKIINPDYGMTTAEIQERINILQQVTGPDVELSMDCLRNSTVYIDSALDVALASAEIVQQAIQAEQQNYDGIILYCLSDPAVVACREAAGIPVLGGGQAAFLTAASLGYNFSLLCTSPQRIPEKKEFIKTTGVDPTRLCSIRSIDVNLSNIRKDMNKTIDFLAREGRRCVEEDGAEVLILGCLSFLGMAEAVSKRIGLPVIDPAMAVVTMMEGFIRQGLCHSQKSYPTPPRGSRTWLAGKVSINDKTN
ncbi:aspartate/glutamate racemase family protein [Desulforamulus aeronauticus]|uniref:Allantoin racemase n=1 Tax=Desulforamulus aeronauticus DSM 10349 TaxID=1121421 RepID=A0A1M6TVM5_9FIRM|nr:aspartate/glutamate racemase family protein [Desulforamulus aeronauticus]SHK60858.1 allantoin racemase [Desulforamulus aeronauticus DSM 10349]